jgi:hypothetical protein
MLRVLSPKKELNGRRERFAQLTEGTLFDLAKMRFFIAVKKINAKSWQVIELTETNKKKIIAGEPCSHSPLHFNEMSCLNLHDVENRL